MSRCFPFPPPGYEKKISTEEADSLIKEKHKEKKHKKDKKDKEKREAKKKKDKETNRDKHKEREEKKDKHRDNKDKDWDKEKSRTSEERKAAGVLSTTGDREKLVTNTLQSNGNGESKFIQDLARRIRDEEKATESESQIPRKFDFPCGVTENNHFSPVPQTNHTKVDEKRINIQGNFAMAKTSGNAVHRVSTCMDQKGAKVMVKPVEKKDYAKNQEKNQRRPSVTKIDKPLDNEGIKKCEPKNSTDKSSKEEKTDVINKAVHEISKFAEGGPRLKEREHDTVDTRNFRVQDLSEAGVKNHTAVDTRNFRVQDLSEAGVKNHTAEGVLGKRKDLVTDGLLCENGFRPNKIQKPVASPISSMENGKELGACRTHPKPVSELKGTVCKPEVKEYRVNGFINSQHPKSQPPVASVKVKENGEASTKKRPHADLKYLDQILNVPKREELHEVDDDELVWLFGQSGVKLHKQRADIAATSVETQQVWNQALRIEPADIVALPYVVPF